MRNLIIRILAFFVSPILDFFSAPIKPRPDCWIDEFEEEQLWKDQEE